MLNYIWAGLIIFSLVFALAHDTSDLARDRYRVAEVPVVWHHVEESKVSRFAGARAFVDLLRLRFRRR